MHIYKMLLQLVSKTHATHLSIAIAILKSPKQSYTEHPKTNLVAPTEYAKPISQNMSLNKQG
jgi:hypothetical protein